MFIYYNFSNLFIQISLFPLKKLKQKKICLKNVK